MSGTSGLKTGFFLCAYPTWVRPWYQPVQMRPYATALTQGASAKSQGRFRSPFAGMSALPRLTGGDRILVLEGQSDVVEAVGVDRLRLPAEEPWPGTTRAACESDHQYLQPLLALRPLPPGGWLALGPDNAKDFGGLGELLTGTATRPAASLGYTYLPLCEPHIQLVNGFQGHGREPIEQHQNQVRGIVSATVVFASTQVKPVKPSP